MSDHLTVIDKGLKKLDGGEVDLHCTALARFGSCGRLIGNMSALQTFMLVVEHDKEEAKRIAESVAQGNSTPALTTYDGSNRVLYRCRKQKNHPD